MLTLAMMKALWPNGDQHVPGLLEGTAAAAPTIFPKYGFATDLMIVHAMAQFSEECGAGLEMTENLNYSYQGLLNTWPSHFTPTLAAKAQRNPQMIADIAYGGRMGNLPPPSDDGWTYRGRGFSQCTGKNEYVSLGQKLMVDIVANPGWLSDPLHALEAGCADFVLCGCLPYAENDDVIGVTRKLNGGLIGLSERERWLGLWKREFGI
jgi:putative chitinase